MNKTIVFSCDTTDKKLSQRQLDKIFVLLFNAGIKVAPAMGVYNGQVENSFICTINQELQEKMILALVKTYKQEAILEIDKNRFSFLRFFNDKPREYVGVWQHAKSMPTDNFSLNLIDGRVYKCL